MDKNIIHAIQSSTNMRGRTAGAEILLYFVDGTFIIDWGTENTPGNEEDFDNLDDAIDRFWEIYYEYEYEYDGIEIEYDHSEKWQEYDHSLHQMGFYEHVQNFKQFTKRKG